jgi:hypothetical protein
MPLFGPPEIFFLALVLRLKYYFATIYACLLIQTQVVWLIGHRTGCRVNPRSSHSGLRPIEDSRSRAQ